MHFVYFIGRFHVLVLHVPITLILVVAGLEWMRRRGRRPDLEPALRLMWAATALTAVATVILGYMHFSEGVFTGPSAQAHRALGTSVAVVATLGWWLRSRAQAIIQRARATIVLGLVVLVTLTGHFGGNLSHGNTYLVEYAPDVIRRMVGLQVARPRVTNVALADPYLDVVRPMFAARCSSCHNADKLSGGLNLDNYAHTMKGGEDGLMIVAGNADKSELLRRISLSPTDDDFMPKEGKTPLTVNQVAIVRWWVQSGAKTGVRLARLSMPADIQPLILQQLRSGPTPASGPAGPTLAAAQQPEEAGVPRKADPKLIDALVNGGFTARQVSLSDPHLVVAPTAPGAQLSAAQIQTLVSLSPDQIVDLNLQDAGLGDAAIGAVVRLTELKRLRLDGDKLTDESVQMLARLGKLERLNLYGNPGVTDASIHALSQMPQLREVFLWQTGVTVSGVQKLKSLRPHLKIDDGDQGTAPAPAAPIPAVENNRTYLKIALAV